jgi:hypothetical protein
VTKDKHRGCLIMGKGLCDGDKTWLGKLTGLGDKISTIMTKATTAVEKMFKDIPAGANDQQKAVRLIDQDY